MDRIADYASPEPANNADHWQSGRTLPICGCSADCEGAGGADTVSEALCVFARTAACDWTIGYSKSARPCLLNVTRSSFSLRSVRIASWPPCFHQLAKVLDEEVDAVGFDFPEASGCRISSVSAT